jgi:phage terminase large subunit-like protein
VSEAFADEPAVERLAALRRERDRRLRARLEPRWAEHAVRWRTPGAFAAFVKLTWPLVEPRTLEWAPYLDVLCHALHRQMMGDPAYRRLLINIPPGHAKSILVSVMAPAFEWLQNPGRRKVYFAGNDRLSRRDSRRTRILLSSGVYRGLLAEISKREGRAAWEFAGDQNQKDNFENSLGGFRKCLTLKTGVTGERGDDFVIDDPIDVKAVTIGSPESILRRCEEAQNIIDQALQTRVNDMRDARQTLIMQRLHLEDPSGHAIREGGWKVICLPLHYDPNHENVCPDDPRTVPGELLHPARTPGPELERLTRKLGPAQAEAQLEQRPVPSTGGRIQRAWFAVRYACAPEDLAVQADEVWITVDAARKAGPTNDFHVMQVWARRGNRRQLLDRVAATMNYPQFEVALDGLIMRWRAWVAPKGGVLIEDTANGTTYLQVRGPSYLGCALIAFHPQADTPGTDKSKAARAVYLERAAESGGIELPAASSWVEDVLTWWCAWPRGLHDDDVDAASQLMMRWTLQESAGESVFDLFAGGM